MMAQEDDTPDVVAEVHRFCDKTLLSKRLVSKLLGISPSTLVRWLDGHTEPYNWTAQQALRRIELFDEYDHKHGLYHRLVSMTPRERVEELERVLRENDDNA